MSEKTNKIPGLRISITPYCNLACEYCMPGGENNPFDQKIITTEEWIQILKIASDIGFKTFIITGGEPLIHTDEVAKIIKEIKKYNNGLKIRLTTNGVNLENELKKIMYLNLDKLVIHLDTLNEFEFREIMGKPFLKNVLRGIKIAKKIFPIRINLVATKKNFKSIFSVIDFCVKNEIDLKILDLNYFEYTGKDYWNKNYQKLDKVIDYLRKNSSIEKIVKSDGGYGIPMLEFTIEKSKMRVKHSFFGTTYTPICSTCPLFPKNKETVCYCQEGLYEIFLSSDGKLRFCRHRADLSLDLKKIDIKNSNEIKMVFQKMLENYFKAFFFHFDNKERLSKKSFGGDLLG